MNLHVAPFYNLNRVEVFQFLYISAHSFVIFCFVLLLFCFILTAAILVSERYISLWNLVTIFINNLEDTE